MITDRLGAVRGPRGLPETAARPRRPAILLISASSAGAFWATGRFPARRTPHAAHDLSHLECIMRRGGFRVHMNQPDGGQAPVQRGGAILSFAGDAKKSATGELSAGSAGQMTFAGRSTNSITLREIYAAVLGEKSLWLPRAVHHRCLVSSNVERYFVGLAARVDKAVLKTLDHKTLADSLVELRRLDATK